MRQRKNGMKILHFQVFGVVRCLPSALYHLCTQSHLYRSISLTKVGRGFTNIAQNKLITTYVTVPINTKATIPVQLTNHRKCV